MIGQKATLMLGNMVLGTFLGLVAAILVGRFFHPTDVGQMTYALGLLGLLSFITDLGMGQAHVKRVSEGRDPGDCFATYAVFKLVTTSIFIAVIAVGLFIYVGLLGKPLEDTTLAIVIVMVAYYVARSLAEVGQSSFDARLETAKSQSAQLVDTLIRVGATILFALVMATLVHGVLHFPGASRFAWVAREPGLALAVASAAGAFAAAIVSLTLLFRTIEWGRFRWELLRDYASFALPLFISSSVSLFSLYVDTTALGFFGADEDAGIFGAVRRLPLVLAGLGTALSALLFPAISMMVARGDHEGVQRTTDGALRYLSIMMVPLAAFVVAFPREILHITLGDQWLAGSAAFAILCVGVIITSFGHAHAYLLLGSDRSRTVAKLGVTSAAVLIVLNLLLVPQDIKSLGIPLAGLGVTGAALATLFAGLVYYAGLRIATRRVLGYRERNHLVKHVLAAAAMAAVLLLLDQTLFPLERWYGVILYALLGAAVYTAALVPLREFTRADVDFLRANLHPGRMLRYVRGEIGQRR